MNMPIHAVSNLQQLRPYMAYLKSNASAHDEHIAKNMDILKLLLSQMSNDVDNLK